MKDIALYYPYVNFPDDAWVKAMALHWPQLGRIRPNSYDLEDSDAVKQLQDELDFVVDVFPRWRDAQPQSWVDDDDWNRLPLPNRDFLSETEDAVEVLFYDFLCRHMDDLIPRYGIDALGIEPQENTYVQDEVLDHHPQLQTVHHGKMSWNLTRHLEQAGLLFHGSFRWRREFGELILQPRSYGDKVMHSRLAGVYLAVLADVVAGENQMATVTDQPLLCATASGWNVDTLARILLDDTETPVEEPRDCSNMFAVMAMQTVLPRDLANVSVERIIEARRRLLPELMRYREFLNSLTPDFIELSSVTDPQVRAVKLGNHVQTKVAQPIEAMERELGRLGLQPVRAVLSLQTLAPPAALGVLGSAVHLPSTLTSAGVVAGCLVGAVSSALNRRRQVLADHPAGYLLHLRHELKPSDTVAQIRSAVRRAAPSPRKP